MVTLRWGSLPICTRKWCATGFYTFYLSLSRNYSFHPAEIQPATSSSSHIINKPQWPSSFGSYTCPRHNTTSTMYDRWCNVLWTISPSFPSLYTSLPIFLMRVNLSKKSCSKTVQAFFLAKCNLVFTCGVTTGLHLELNPLYLYSRRCLLIVDFGNDEPVSLRAFMVWLDALKTLRILLSSSVIVQCTELATFKVSAIALVFLGFFH